MNAKEKANELFNKFKDFADEDYMDTKQQFELNETRNLNAKKCALIAVDEIINHHSQEQGLYRIDTYYWQQVKSELQSL
jgi:hypothetical protein